MLYMLKVVPMRVWRAITARAIAVVFLLLFFVFHAVWFGAVVPLALRMPAGFSYSADVVSYDDFYDARSAGYSGPVRSDTVFSYESTRSSGGVSEIANTFDVRRPTGEPIFSVTRSYGIDRASGQHVAGFGDRDRSGYLFAPRGLHKQDFTYWHVNYDQPLTMVYRNEETIVGVDTHRYEAKFVADQTGELTNLPGVGVEKGVSLDVTLQLWIEPTSGHLVKYEDDAFAHFYDLASGRRLQPWNHFNNQYSFTSIVAQARFAEKEKRKIQMVQIATPIIVSIVLVGSCIALLSRQRLKIKQVVTLSGAAAAMAVVSQVFWYTSGLSVGLPEWLEPMYLGASISVLLIAGVLYGRVRHKTWTPLQRHGVALGLSIWSVYITLIATDKLLGWGIPFFEVRVVGGSEPFILPLAALSATVYALALALGLWRQNRIVVWVQELLTASGVVMNLLSIIAYAYGRDSELLVRLQDVRLPAALALLFLGLAIFMFEQKWFFTRQFLRLGKGAWLFVVVLLGMVGLTGLGWQTTRAAAVQQSQLQFQSDINTLQNAISDRLRIYTNSLYGGEGLFNASDYVDRGEWKSYVDSLHLSENYPGTQGLGFAQIVPKDQLEDHVASIRAEGFPEYNIRPLDPPRDRYSSIIYLEPFDERNQRAFGYDMFSEITRRTALERAAYNGVSAMTGRVTLLQETDEDVQYGFLIYVPVYSPGLALTTADERQEALFGYVYSAFRMNNFMQAIVGNLANGIDIEVFDISDPEAISEQSNMYKTSKTIDRNSAFQDVQTITSSGHTWSLRYTGSRDYILGVDQNVPNFVLYGGLVLSFSLAAAVFALSTSRQRAVLFAQKVTHDLRLERNDAVRTEHRDEAMLDGLNEGLIVFDRNGRIERINNAALSMLGYFEDELVGKPYYDVLQAVDEKGKMILSQKRPAEKALKGSKTSKVTLQYTRRDRSLFTASVSVAPIMDKGHVVGAIEIFYDVTQEHELEAAKDEFLSLASHQLRTPLTAKRWNLELLLNGDVSGKLSTKQRDLVSRVNESNERMIKLVNELLNVSRVESGRLTVAPEKTDIAKLLQSVADDTMPKIVEKKQKLTLDMAKLPRIAIDPILIRQVFLNLLTNASKYSPDGSEIVIRSERDGPYVKIAVQDHGYGIPREQHAKIFRKFFRADNIRKRETDGNGLGLYLVQSIVEASGGKIRFESQVDRGTTFYVSLPIQGSKARKGKVTVS